MTRFLIFTILAVSAAFAQSDWQGAGYSETSDRKAGLILMTLDPDVSRVSPTQERYKRITIEDLLRGLVRFPDELTRYVAIKDASAFTDFTKSEMLAGVSIDGWGQGLRPPYSPTIRTVRIGIAVPRDPDYGEWLRIYPDDQAPGNPQIGSLRKSATTFTVGEDDEAVHYDVWHSAQPQGAWQLPGSAVYFGTPSSIPDELPQAAVEDATAEEGESVVFTITLSAAPARTANVTMTYRTEDSNRGNAAVEGVDYTAASGTLAFTPSETSKTISVATLENAQGQPDRAFQFFLDNPVGVKFTEDYSFHGKRLAEGTIEDDD